jgi:hypothetical protein
VPLLLHHLSHLRHRHFELNFSPSMLHELQLSIPFFQPYLEIFVADITPLASVYAALTA